MAIHYNLAKVFEQTNSNSALVKKTVESFVNDLPIQCKNLILTIKNKQYELTYQVALKIKPAFELMGMTIAYDEIEEVEHWALKKGKRKQIEATMESLKLKIDKAVKEMNKDFKLTENMKV